MTVWGALGIGVSLGIGAGVTPGPLLGLVITETLRKGWRAGVSVALAPLVGDVFVIACCLILLAQLPSVVFAMLSLGGGFYVLFLGWETLRTVPPATMTTAASRAPILQSFRKGLTVNLLNPHPYLFWLAVGGPFIMQHYVSSAFGAILAFLGGFYGCLIGSKVLLALLVHSGRTRLQGLGYRIALQLSGVLLLLLGGLLIREALRTLGIWEPTIFVPYWSVS
jgi:threonine/homoserine/homoserine lactone efflux protein